MLGIGDRYHVIGDRHETTVLVDPASCFGAAYRFIAAPPRPDAP
jgi:hypothetical protein